jgi:general nucleoside transport system permease protein
MITRLRAQLLVPAGAIVLALIVGAVIIIVTSPLAVQKLDLSLPLATYWALVQGSLGSIDGIVDTLRAASPLILVGLAVALPFKAGLFNIGGQGQFLIGAVTAAWVGAALSGASPFVALPVAVLAGMLAGAAYGFIPGWLKAYTGAHEVVTTIMLNYIAMQIVSYFIQGPLKAPGATFARSADVGNSALPVIFQQTAGHPAHLGIIFPYIAAVLVWWLLYRTTIGFEIRTAGANPDAARYAGMRPRFLIVLTMVIAGLLVGLAGAGEILGVQGYMVAGYSTNVGFDAITVALLGRTHPFGVVLAGLLLGAMRAGAPLMQISAGIPVQMVDVLQGVILFFLTADIVVRWVFRIRAAGSGGPEKLATVSASSGGSTAK